MTEGTVNRRVAIADAAVAVIAESGARGLSHRAVDQRLGLPSGSVSYYFRTREALTDAAIEAIAQRARVRFAELTGPAVEPAAAASVVAQYLDDLVSSRADDVRARYALLTEVSDRPARMRALRDCLFSETAALTLMSTLDSPRPAAAAADLLSLCEGLMFDHITGRRPARGRRRDLLDSVQRHLDQVGR